MNPPSSVNTRSPDRALTAPPPARIGTALRGAAQVLARRAARLRSHTVTIDGVPVVYDEGRLGAGPAVVMLHGFSASREVWTRFAVGLDAHHLLIPDLAGHGANAFQTGAGYSAPAQAARLLALLNRLGIARAHLIGNSMGGFIAATLALHAPERVLSLALVDAAGVSSPELSAVGRMIDGGYNPFLLDDAGQFDAFYALTMARPPFVPRAVRRAIAADYVNRRAELAEIFADFHDHDWLDERLGEILTPTWIAWGRHDQVIDVSTAHAWAAGVPRARLTIYDDLGHMPMLEAPGRVRRDYGAFLASVPPAPSA